jgi:nicotinate phosphoribosyltransferase
MDTRTSDERLAAWIFDLPVVELRAGYRSAVYFDRSRRILAAEGAEGADTRVTMQVFQRSDAMVACGIDEALAVLALGAGSLRDAAAADRAFDDYLAARNAARRARLRGGDAWVESVRTQVEAEAAFDRHWEPARPGQLEVKALRDGYWVGAWEPVIELTGAYRLVAHLESIYLGVLARRTLVASNVRRVVDAAGGKPVLFFADRFDHCGHRRPGRVVGRAWPRHHPTRPDRHLRRRHGGRGGGLRPPVPRGAADRPGRLRQ